MKGVAEKMKKIMTAAMILATILISSCATETPTATPENASEVSLAESTLESMSLEEKIWQMFFVTPEDITDFDVVIQAGDATKQAIEKYPVGGIVYFAQNIESREQISEMIANTQSYSKIPLFISVDEEGGRVARLGNAGIIATQPPMAQIGTMGEDGIEEARKIGEFFGTELSELGFNMDFAPVADVITVENNEDIGDRSFGNDPELVAKMVVAEIEGMQEQNLCAVLKHFPSNGSTETNTHESTGVCTRTLDEMRQCEFIPFKAGIDAGVDVVMVAHMAAVNIVGNETPSTLSSIIIQDYLRGELGFDKLVISDALNMGAIANVYTPEDAAVEAVKAGVDLLLMSPDPQAAEQAILEKVQSGEISESRIDESVLRILQVKEERGILQ
jgi:beta-N-acetylhexosaminidase